MTAILAFFLNFFVQARKDHHEMIVSTIFRHVARRGLYLQGDGHRVMIQQRNRQWRL
jgi:hypothetical protein